MPDYTGLTTEQLIAELDTRDATITAKDTEITALNQTVSDKDVLIDSKVQENLQLNSANEQLQTLLDEKEAENVSLSNSIENIKTPVGTLNSIVVMNAENKKELAKLIRTSPEGRKAAIAINHGK